MEGPPASFDHVVWHRRTLDEDVQESLAPIQGEPVEHGAKPHRAEKLSQFGCVDGDVRSGGVAQQRQCGWIGTVEGNRKFPERWKGTRPERIDDLLVR